MCRLIFAVAVASLASSALAFQPVYRGPVQPLSVPDPNAKPLSAEAPLLPVAPDWERKPDADALVDLYPDRALKEHVGGSTKVRCAITKSGTLAVCVIVSESPTGYGFGRLSIQATRYYKMRPQMPDGTSVEGFSIEIPMTWAPH